MADDRWCAGQFHLRELRHLHQFAIAAGDVVAEDVVHVGPLLGAGLQVDVADLAVFVGEPCVAATSEGGDGGHRLLVVDIQGTHHGAIDLELEGRRAGNELGVEGGEHAALTPRLDQFLGFVIELVEAVTAGEIVELEVEAPLC